MRRGDQSDAVRWAIIGAAAAIVLASALACRLDRVWAAEVPDASSGAAARLLGESRRALSGDLYMEGDVFLHRGGHSVESAAFSNRFFQRIGVIMAPSRHLHVEGAQAAEVLPWLRLATSADPHNVDAWMASAFLAETAAGRNDVASGILAEARAANPRDYRLPLEQARLLMRRRVWDRAARELATAQRLWPNPAASEDEEARLDRAELLTYRGYLLELGGALDEAARFYRQTLELYPARLELAVRADCLTRRRAPALDIQTALNNVFVAKQGDAGHDDENHAEEHEGASPHLSHVIH